MLKTQLQAADFDLVELYEAQHSIRPMQGKAADTTGPYAQESRAA